MSFHGHAHWGKDKVRRKILATLGAAAILALAAVPATASHNSGTDQYQPSAPPGQGGGGGGGTAAPPSAPEPEPLPPLPEADPATVPTDDAGITVPGPDAGDDAAGDDALPSAGPRSSGEDDALELADAEPLSVAALRPRAAIGAQASSDELGIIAPAAGIVLLLLGATVLLRRGRGRTAGAS